MNELNIVYFFFNDDFYRWPVRTIIEPFVKSFRNITIIGVTFPISLLTIFYNPKRFIKFLFKPKKKIMENIYSFTPFGFLPVRLINKNRILTIIHKWLFGSQINKFLNDIKAYENRITWIYTLDAFPVFSDVVKDSRLMVYDCEDENTMNGNAVLRDMKETEDSFLKKADVVFVVSKKIYATRKWKNRNCYLIPNGVDFDFFSGAASVDTPLNEGIKNIPRPIAGYLGNVRDWLDFELLEFLADNLPTISFVFVGPIEQDVRREIASLKKRPNVYFLGRKDREALPGILKGFDICLIPFKYNEFNLATNPLKFWEYLATGKPILSLKIPDFEPYEDILALYTTKEEALDKMRLLLEKDDEHLKKRRMELAKNNDIIVKSKEWYDILKKHLYGKERDA